MQAFKDKMNAVKSCFLKIIEQAGLLNDARIADKCAAQIENMAQDHFNVMVTGDFSNGKSIQYVKENIRAISD